MIIRALAIFFSLIFVINTPAARAQYYFYNNDYYDNPVLFELGGSIAFMNSLTDLGGKKGVGKKFIKDLNVRNSHVGASIYFTATYNNMLALRLEGTFGQVSGADSVLKDVAPSTYGRYERNLSFRSRITDLMLIGEFHPIHVFGNFNQDKMPPRISPYVLAGVGVFSFNPEAKLYNNWIRLQPLSTEGQGFKEYPESEPYKLTQICIPLGAGARFELSPLLNVRAEFIYRVLSTDHLDDLSGVYVDPRTFTANLSATRAAQASLLYSRRHEIQPGYTYPPGQPRGNAEDNDAYLTFNLKIGLIIGRKSVR